MATCALCNKSSPLISAALALCADCIRCDLSSALPLIRAVHHRTRKEFGLPVEPPRSPNGLSCNLCANQCRIALGHTGYCGLRRNDGGRLSGASAHVGRLSFYHDPLPTNCVADWVCEGGRPRERGYKNLAVFYFGCSFNCLFCQNWHHRQSTRWTTGTAEDLAAAVDDQTHCICCFGGDPAVQLPHSIRASRLALKRRRGATLRICWETNGSMDPKLLPEISEIALSSGGCVKLDLKAWTSELSVALCGLDNRQTLENFEALAARTTQRPEPPFLIASTLLVPGYVDQKEVQGIASFLANLNPEIPYSLLAFHPQLHMSDLPTTSAFQAQSCYRVAKQAGLKNVRIANVHLLNPDNAGV